MESELRKDLEGLKIQNAVIVEKLDNQKSAFDRVFKKFEAQDASIKLINKRLVEVERDSEFIRSLKKYLVPILISLAAAGAGISLV